MRPPMRAGRPAFIMDHSNRIVAACYRKFTTTTRAKNNVSRDLEHAIASDETRMREQTKPAMRSYLAVTRNFASGNASPRQFLERSLELLESWEPRVGAFVCTNLSVARAGADRASYRWRGARHASDRFGHSPREFLRLCGFQTERKRDQPRGQPRLSKPKLHRYFGRVTAGRLASRARNCRACRRRCRHARPARARHDSACREAAPPRGARNWRLGRSLGRRQAAARRIC